MAKKLRVRARYDPRNDVTLRVADCRSLLRKMPDRSVRLVVTSPPYNIGKPYETVRGLDAYTAEQSEVIRECVRILRDDGSICWQVGNYVSSRGDILPLDIHLHHIFAECGLRLRNRIIWHFEHGLHCRRRFSGRYETILWYTKSKDYVLNLDAVRVLQKYPGKRACKGPRKGKFSGNPRGKNPGDVWIFPNVKSNHVEKTIHPCQFPVELPERLVLALTDVGDLVVDPYAGVGTTLVAAVLHGRKAAGTDIVKAYVDCARRRLRRLENGTLRHRPMDSPVHVPPPRSPLVAIPPNWYRAWLAPDDSSA
ncbi:MAG: site-specific DNA-methyltransferase [Armatimonadetes bacterium]|nr:site-specific DNA-methyltransferase [Armatimonadota bacterium]NIM24220.1 site-specific DNA-methyltransferase [Armatimonadota bacterium]NIM68089.1 site-specific DNA-methyltransferase [Armatimonadota bacterium]NIM76551.1 site-specific DNA-methyltransferase [Armatimonadota bacterium]NIN06294.1 site-specific DNA-methyltransferase [Armatimonadota bacterium]